MQLPTIASLLLCAAFTCAAQAPPETAPEAAPKELPEQFSPARNFDLQQIDAELRLDWPTQRLHGKVRLDLQAFRAANKVLLDAAALEIEKITDADGRMLRFQLSPDATDGALSVDLAHTVLAGAHIQLHIDYQSTHRNESDPNALAGSNGKGLRFLEKSFTEPRRRTQAWVHSEMGGVRYWLPGIDQHNEQTLANLHFVLPNALSVAAVGELSKKTAADADHQRWEYRLAEPQTMAKLAFTVGEYELVEQRTKISGREITLRHFAYPDELQATRDSVEQMPAMMQFFSDYTGIPYWRDSYQQVMVQDQAWGIFTPNLAIQSENMVDDWPTHDEYQYLWDHLSAEGLAWQWTGGLISPREPRDEWLLRSLNRFLDAKWDQHYRGTDDEYTLWPNTWDFGTYFADWAAGVRQAAVTRRYATNADLLASNAPLTRGTLALRLLEDQVGAALFRQAIQLFLQRHRGQLVSTEQFFAALEDVSGESWNWFQRQWLEGIAHPQIALSQRYENGVLIVELQQKSALDDPSAVLFQGWMSIEMDGELQRVWLKPQARNRFEFKRETKPSYVFVDPQRRWIMELKTQPDRAELRAQIQGTRYAFSRNWAIAELIKLTATDAPSQAASMDAILQVSERKDLYWRARYAALAQLSAWVAPSTKLDAVSLAPEIEARLITLIKQEQKWLKAQAISLLGATQNPVHAALYQELLTDRFDRVVNAAAFSLGRSKAPGALAALLALPERPSWKQQSLISALNGLRVLGDRRGSDLAVHALTQLDVPRWTLATPVWDYRQTAAQTLLALGAGDAAWPMLKQRFDSAFKEKNVLDIFNTLMLASMLELKAAEQWLPPLRKHYAKDPNALQAIDAFQAQFDELREKRGSTP
jgi:aminopeptidase N